MIYAHLMAQDAPKKVMAGIPQSEPDVELFVIFVSDDKKAEAEYTKIFNKQTQAFNNDGIRQAVTQFERLLCYHEFIPAGKTAGERTYYKINHKSKK